MMVINREFISFTINCKKRSTFFYSYYSGVVQYGVEHTVEPTITPMLLYDAIQQALCCAATMVSVVPIVRLMHVAEPQIQNGDPLNLEFSVF